MKMKKNQGEVQKNKVDKQFEDDVEDDHPKFDILNWWKLITFKYYIISCMTRDILTINVSIFSIEDKILDSFCSSLSSTIVETLICVQNQFKSIK